MRKIDSEYENPIDNNIISFVDYTSPFFKYLNMSANDITTLSLITGLGSVYYLNNDQYSLSSFLFLISYMFDCLDGFYARKYNMVTFFGDIYDHIKDWLVMGLIFYLFYIKATKYRIELLIVLIISSTLVLLHFGCQELIYHEHRDDESPIIKFTTGMCPTSDSELINIKKAINYTKYFGSGTITLILTLIIYNFNKFV